MGQVVEDHHHGFPLLRQQPGLLHQLKLVGDVQKGRRLVQQNHLGVLSQGHGNIDLLPLAAGQPLQRAVRQIGNAHLLHGGFGAGIVLLPVDPGEIQIGKPPMEHQPLHRDIRHLAALGQIGDFPGQQPLGKLQNVLPVQQHLPARNGQQTAQRFQQRGLAAAVRAEKNRHFSLRKRQIHVLQHRISRISGRKMLDFNHGHDPLSGSEAESGIPDRRSPT